MAKGVNKAIIVGRLGQEPEVRYMPNGNAVANFTVATSEQWKDQQGQKQEKTEWHRITIYGKLAEIAGKYLHKGSNVYLEGRLQTREWTDQQQVKRYTTEIIVNEMQMLDGAPQQQGQQQAQPMQQQRQHPVQQPAQQQPQQGYQYSHQQAQQPQNAGGFNEPPFEFSDTVSF